MREQPAQPLQSHIRRDAQNDPRTQHLDRGLDDQQQSETHRKDVQVFSVRADGHLVNQELVEDGRRQCEDLESDGEQKYLNQGRAQPCRSTRQIA
ncbi:MAG TPA: hypothetical protein PL143_20690 [Rhodocyclaceae bacterium]|nr:hypothetical protein [Rhodocyclaceae bacterium]